MSEMTEEEAKQKWCPHTQVAHGNMAEFGRANCIGSACMMWRWDAITPEEKRQLRVYGDDTGPLLVIPGYCGLGGKP